MIGEAARNGMPARRVETIDLDKATRLTLQPRSQSVAVVETALEVARVPHVNVAHDRDDGESTAPPRRRYQYPCRPGVDCMRVGGWVVDPRRGRRDHREYHHLVVILVCPVTPQVSGGSAPPLLQHRWLDWRREFWAHPPVPVSSVFPRGPSLVDNNVCILPHPTSTTTRATTRVPSHYTGAAVALGH